VSNYYSIWKVNDYDELNSPFGKMTIDPPTNRKRKNRESFSWR
jgi:hypothetical protein